MGKNQTAKKGANTKSSSPQKKNLNPVKRTYEAFYYPMLIIFLVYLMYGNTINYGYVLDDDLVGRSNKFVNEGFAGIPHILSNGYLVGTTGVNDSYRPLLMVHLAIEKQFFGFNPSVNHFFNVFYYGIMGILLFIVLCRIFKNIHKIIPLIITLLFLSHPIHTEVVANIKSRDEIFCLIFLLMSILSLFNYLDKRKIISIILSPIWFFLAVLSKENALTYLAIIPLILFFFTNEKLKRILTLTLPYLGAAGLFLLIRASIVHGNVSTIDLLYNSLMGITSTSERLATAIFIFGKYIQLLIFPHPLVWDYSFNQIPPVSWTNIYTIVTLVVCFGLMIYAIMKTKSRDIFAFCILYFFITMSITSNIFILIGATMAERFLFLPSLGFCIAIIFLINKLLKIDNTGKSKHNFKTLYIISGIVIVAYLFKTIDRSKDWKDSMSLYESGVIGAPNSCRTHTALANEYSTLAQSLSDANRKTELFKKAEAEFKTGLNIYPKNPESWYNLGVLYFAMGNIPEAEKANKQVIVYNPLFAKAYNNLGAIEGQRGEFKEAAQNFKKAADLDSNYLDAISNTASAYFNLKEYKNAEPYYKRAHELNPQSKPINDQLIENEKRLAQDTSSVKKTP